MLLLLALLLWVLFLLHRIHQALQQERGQNTLLHEQMKMKNLSETIKKLPAESRQDQEQLQQTRKRLIEVLEELQVVTHGRILDQEIALASTRTVERYKTAVERILQHCGNSREEIDGIIATIERDCRS